MSTKPTPAGSAPLTLNVLVEAGNPLVVTVNVPATPTVNVVDAELEIPNG